MMYRAPRSLRVHAGRRAALIAWAAVVLAARADAASFTVFWDGETFPGYGVSEATAQAAAAAGIPLLPFTGVLVNDQETSGAEHIATTNALDPSSLAMVNNVATATANWTGTNQTLVNSGAGPAEQLYLVFASPGEIFLDGQPTGIDSTASDVGLMLSFGEGGTDWAILQIPSDPLDPASDPVYYPAVALGPLGVGDTAGFQLNYQLVEPYVVPQPFIFDLGIPQWNVYYSSSSMMVPEPATGLLLLAGLVSFAAARRRAR